MVNFARYSPDGKRIAALAYDPKKMFAPNEVADDELGRGRMMRTLDKLLIIDRASGETRTIADYHDGTRGPICWTPDGSAVFFSRYLPKDDNRERTLSDKEHGLVFGRSIAMVKTLGLSLQAGVPIAREIRSNISAREVCADCLLVRGYLAHDPRIRTPVRVRRWGSRVRCRGGRPASVGMAEEFVDRSGGV